MTGSSGIVDFPALSDGFRAWRSYCSARGRARPVRIEVLVLRGSGTAKGLMSSAFRSTSVRVIVIAVIVMLTASNSTLAQTGRPSNGHRVRLDSKLRDLIGRAGRLRAASHHPHHFTPEDLRELRLTWRTIEAGLAALVDDFEIDSWG